MAISTAALRLFVVTAVLSCVMASDCPNGYQWNDTSSSCVLNCSAMSHAYPALNESLQCVCETQFIWNGSQCYIDCASISNSAADAVSFE